MRACFSPCPNDTFIFHAWVHGLLKDAPSLEVRYLDIDQTNRLGMLPDGPDILKVSVASLPWILGRYSLLPCGGALGHGCGPLVITKQEKFIDNPQLLHKRTIAIPSTGSTAHLLFQLWSKSHGIQLNTVTLPFHHIMHSVQREEIDAGLIIHEGRFTYSSYDLKMVCDLGTWWDKQTNLPIPLGAIVLKSVHNQEDIIQHIRASLDHGIKNPHISQEYIAHHAQEMDSHVISSHIKLYVNDYTYNLSDKGYLAIKTLLNMATDHGLAPACTV